MMWLRQMLQNRIWSALGQSLRVGFIFLGLPLIAWGMDASSAFFANPARICFACAVGLQAALSAWLLYSSPPRQPAAHLYNISHLHANLFEAILIVSAFGDRRNLVIWGESAVLRWVGVGIYLCGLALSVWSNVTWVRHLRSAGAAAAKDPVLLFEGPFKWIRYPSMVYLFVYTAGAATLFRSWIGLVLLLPLIGAIVNRVNNLDRMYAEQYKKIWPLRRHTSKRLIPYLY